MLKKVYRLKNQKDFKKVLKEGRGLKENFLFLKFLLGKGKTNRFGIIIARNVSKKAVVRNKIKRRIKSVIAQNLRHFKEGFDCVFVVLPGFENKSFFEIKKTVINLLTKARLFNVKKDNS